MIRFQTFFFIAIRNGLQTTDCHSYIRCSSRFMIYLHILVYTPFRVVHFFIKKSASRRKLIKMIKKNKHQKDQINKNKLLKGAPAVQCLSVAGLYIRHCGDWRRCDNPEPCQQRPFYYNNNSFICLLVNGFTDINNRRFSYFFQEIRF